MDPHVLSSESFVEKFVQVGFFCVCETNVPKFIHLSLYLYC